MKKIFLFLFVFISIELFHSQNLSKHLLSGCWKVNYFASGNENTAPFPETLLMEYSFSSSNEYVYSVSDLAAQNKNNQTGKFQINNSTILLFVEDTQMLLKVFRSTSTELIFKSEIEGEELFFILNKVSCQ